MTTIPGFIMKKLFQILSPESHAYTDIREKKISTFQSQLSDAVVTKLKVGDIIFTSTPNPLHQEARKFVGVQYDHVSVVISGSQGIHISPPTISKMPLRYLVLPSHKPLVVRLNWSENEIDSFVLRLNSFIKQGYDYAALWNLLKEQVRRRLSVPAKYEFTLSNLKHHHICTNVITYCLCKVNPILQIQIKKNPKSYGYSQLGAFLTDDIITLLKNTNSITQIHRGEEVVSEGRTNQIWSRLKNINFISSRHISSQGLIYMLNLLRKFTMIVSKREAFILTMGIKVLNLLYELLQKNGMPVILNMVKILLLISQIPPINIRVKQLFPFYNIVNNLLNNVPFKLGSQSIQSGVDKIKHMFKRYKPSSKL